MSGTPHGAPPQIPGFDYLSHIGSGGFADVFCYQQLRPRRKVAIKVLAGHGAAAARLAREADVMARLSSHPNILTIYQVVEAHGASYLVTEYCPAPTLAQRCRRGPLTVAEVLETGVQLCAAVHSAHLAGISHRDVKPANVLVTEYGTPVLADFGLATGKGNDGGGQAAISVPWSAPEALNGVVPTPALPATALDVWGISATLYTLLAGHSPFAVPGGDNSRAALSRRISRAPLPTLPATEVPHEVQDILAVGMAKAPGERYSSAAALGQALRREQSRLALPLTPLRILPAPNGPGPLTAEPGHDESRHHDLMLLDVSTASRTAARGWTPVAAQQRASDSGPAVITADRAGESTVFASEVLRANRRRDAAEHAAAGADRLAGGRRRALLERFSARFRSRHD